MTLGQIERLLNDVAKNPEMSLREKVNKLEDALGESVQLIKTLVEQIVIIGKLHNQTAEMIQSIYE